MIHEMFGKKFLFGAAIATLALLGVLIIFSIPVRPRASSNEHFGNVKEVYEFASVDGWVPVELEGDTDVFPSAEIRMYLETANFIPDIYDLDTRTYIPFSQLQLFVQIDAALGKRLINTSRRYENGESVGEPEGYKGYVGGYIERFEDGRWVDLTGMSGNSSSASGINTVICSVTLPSTASGRYRFTHYFREYTTDSGAYTPSRFSTGDELYTVSYIVDIPELKTIEPSGKPLDLLAFTLTHDAQSRSQAKTRSQFEVVLRADGIEPPYIRSYETRLQRLDGNRWCDVESDNPWSDNSWDKVVYISIVNPTATVFDPDGESETCLRVTGRLYTPESGSYRLILGFTEKEYGKGKMYPLTIYFDIPEED